MRKPRRNPPKEAGLVPVNAAGRRIGEGHPGAVLTDHEIDLVRDLHENHGYGYRRLAALFNVSRTAIRMYCIYLKRAQTVAGFKAVRRT